MSVVSANSSRATRSQQSHAGCNPGWGPSILRHQLAAKLRRVELCVDISCLWQLRSPTHSGMIVVSTRVTIHRALRTTVADTMPFIACLRSRRDHGAKLVDSIVNICTFAVTLSYDYAARVYFPLCVVLATCQYFADVD